jgi:nucleotide-binding universal stress UspA family protein
MFKSILVPIDVDHDGAWERALEAAFTISRADGAALHIMHVIRATPPVVAQYLPADYASAVKERVLTEIKEKVKAQGVTESEAQFSVRYGEVYPEILDYAEEISADLIVLAAHKPGVTDYLLGTTAARVARHAKCSVFLIRN